MARVWWMCREPFGPTRCLFSYAARRCSLRAIARAARIDQSRDIAAVW